MLADVTLNVGLNLSERAYLPLFSVQIYINTLHTKSTKQYLSIL